jgi:acyl-CoA reductase-like NAD-dependent aldehyde dehydrogenase
MQAEALPNQEMFIGGSWVPSHSGRNYPVFNPATGQVLAHVPKGDSEDVRAAVDAAEKAFQNPEWRSMDPRKEGGSSSKWRRLSERGYPSSPGSRR